MKASIIDLWASRNTAKNSSWGTEQLKITAFLEPLDTFLGQGLRSNLTTAPSQCFFEVQFININQLLLSWQQEQYKILEVLLHTICIYLLAFKNALTVCFLLGSRGRFWEGKSHITTFLFFPNALYTSGKNVDCHCSASHFSAPNVHGSR